MNLFIDTTNEQFIVALINNNKVVKFESKQTDRSMVKNANLWLNSFLEKNEVKILDFKEVFLTIGPGSFTGIKVGLNIVNTIALIKPKLKVNTISTLDLISNDDKIYTVLKITNKRFLVKKGTLFSRTKEMSSIEKLDPKIIQFGYKGFDKKVLEYKIENNYFKRVKNINKVNLIF